MRSTLGTRYTEQGMRAAGSLSLRPCFACVCPAAAPAARLPGCPAARWRIASPAPDDPGPYGFYG